MFFNRKSESFILFNNKILCSNNFILLFSNLIIPNPKIFEPGSIPKIILCFF